MSRNVAARAGRNPAPRDRDFQASEPTALYTHAGARKYLNADERRRFLASLGAARREEAVFARLMFWTGARVSELLALRLSDFQLDAGIVAIRTLKRRRFSMREIPIPPALVTEIADHAQGPSVLASPDPLLWHLHRVTAWRLVKDAMRRAGIAGPQASPRGLRHGFAIAALQAGVPLTLLQRWMGHSRLSTTTIYLAVSGPEERELAARFWREAA